jgi:hypothetical protein
MSTMKDEGQKIGVLKNETLLRIWGNHAAEPFQGRPRSEVEQPLKTAMSMAFRGAHGLVEGIENAVVAFAWDSGNKIFVVTDIELMTDQMLVVRAAECVQ